MEADLWLVLGVGSFADWENVDSVLNRVDGNIKLIVFRSCGDGSFRDVRHIKLTGPCRGEVHLGVGFRFF
jgi:hypothetical protein